MIRKILIAAALGLLAPALADAGPDLKPGDVFVYQAGARTYSQTYEGPGPDGGHVFRADNGDWLDFNASLSLTGLAGSRIVPHNGQLALDPDRGFALGESWVTDYQIRRDDGSRVTKTRTCTVSAHEPELIVRAGTFDAYRVDCTIQSASGPAVYGESWYDARTWRSLMHSVGAPGGELDRVLELIAFERQP